jgi:flagellar biosynthesis protein
MPQQQKKTNKKAKQLKRHLDMLNLPERNKLKAIAIKYDVSKDRAPKIIATGKGIIAEKILALAEENNIPFFEDPALSELLAKLDIESEVPPDLYTLVAEVLAFVYQLNKLAKKKKTRRKKAKRSRL